MPALTLLTRPTMVRTWSCHDRNEHTGPIPQVPEDYAGAARRAKEGNRRAGKEMEAKTSEEQGTSAPYRPVGMAPAWPPC